MAEVVTAATVLSTFLDFASKVQTLGENYYKASAEWKDFPRRVKNLRRQGNICLATYTKYGISDEDLIDALKEASLLLAAEEEKLSNREKSEGTTYARLAGCCARAHGVAFPSAIDLTIQPIEAAFADVQNLLKWKEDVKVGGESELMNRSYSLRFKQDERYVPLDDTERQIYSALENSGPRILVLLYGGPGRGKSCLARNVALHYNSVRKENPKVTDCILFDQVVFLQCGPKAETTALQQKLLQHLGLDKLSSTEDEEGVSQLLIGALQSQKILIIFDDVEDGLVLQQMIDVCGDNVKCLVTSQMAYLCSRLNYLSLVKVPIQEISEDIGRKILAAHVRFPNKSIENDHIKEIADKIFKDTTGNPLALASVVSAIEETGRDSPEAWAEAYSDLQELLKTEDTARMFGQQYGPRSFWSATKLSIKALTKQAQSLLILVHLCKGPSVPEEVIRFLFRTNLLGGGTTFQTLVNQLDGRELVKINHSLTINNDHSEKSWSTHSLQKKFMDQDEEMRAQKGKMFDSLLEFASTMDPKLSTKSEIITESLVEDEDAMVTRVLSALYFDDDFAEKAGSQLSIVNDGLKVQRRQAFEPITRLLGKLPSDRWTTAAQTAAKQAFVKYFCKAELDDENISLLLNMTACPSTQFATLHAIADIHIIEKASLLNEDSKVLIGLVSFLHNNAAPKLQKKAASALKEVSFVRSCSYSGEASIKVLEVYEDAVHQEASFGLFDVHEEGSSEHNHGWHYLSQAAARRTCLASPLARRGGSAKLQILNEARALIAGLVRLAKDFSSPLQSLASFWQNNAAPKLQKKAASALKELSFFFVRHSETSCPGYVGGSSEDNPGLQTQAAAALASLARGGESAKLQILNQAGALAGLVRSLAKDRNPPLQKFAARALASLANGGESAKLQILNQAGALAGLVRSLAKDRNPPLQEFAATALRNLGNGVQSLKDTILKEEGALEGLVHSISNDDNPGLQAEAAAALANLANGGESAKVQILNQAGALAGLVRSLAKDRNPASRKFAATALRNLANGVQSLQDTILKEEGALEGLVLSISSEDYPSLQTQAAAALASLASGGESAQLQILNQEGALVGLVRCLSKDGNPSLQLNAAWALENLAEGPQSSKLKILKEDGALMELVKSVLKHDKSVLQTHARGAVENLVAGGEEIRLQVLDENTGLADLVNSILEDYNSHQQGRAVATL